MSGDYNLLAGTGTYTSRTGPLSLTHQAKKQQPKTTTKNTIMTSRPIILHTTDHRRLYFSAYTPPPLAIDGMTDSPDIVRQYGADCLAGCAR